MKKNQLILILATIFAQHLYGQNLEDHTQDELKYWYKHPKEWKEYRDSILAAKASLVSNNDQNIKLAKDEKNYKYELQVLYDQIADKIDQLDSVIDAKKNIRQAIIDKQNTPKDIIFRIQIANLKNTKNPPIMGNNTSLSIESVGKDSKRFLILYFKNYNEASAFAQTLGENTYVVAYKNNKQIWEW